MELGIRTNKPWQNSWGSTLLNYRGAQGYVSKISVTKTKLQQVGASYFVVGANYYTTMNDFTKLMCDLKQEFKPTLIDKYIVSSNAVPASYTVQVDANYENVYNAFTPGDGKIELVIFNCQGFYYKSGIDQQCETKNWTINLTQERFSDIHFEKYICYDPITGLITKVEDSVQQDKHQIFIYVDLQSNDGAIPMYDTKTISKDDDAKETSIFLYQTGESYPVKLKYSNQHYESGSDSRIGLYEMGTNARHFYLLSPGIPTLDFHVNYTVVSDYEQPEVYSKI